MDMTCPPQRVKTYGTPSRRSARATTRPPCIVMRSRSEFDLSDVGNALAHERRQLLLHAHLDLPHALARAADRVAREEEAGGVHARAHSRHQRDRIRSVNA